MDLKDPDSVLKNEKSKSHHGKKEWNETEASVTTIPVSTHTGDQ